MSARTQITIIALDWGSDLFMFSMRPSSNNFGLLFTLLLNVLHHIQASLRRSCCVIYAGYVEELCVQVSLWNRNEQRRNRETR